MAITPKCKNGDTLYVTPFGTLRPCCWMPEQYCWKTFDVDPKWNMNITPVKQIKEKTVLEFAESMQKQPLGVCKRMCSGEKKEGYGELFNATQKMVIEGESE